MGASITAMAGNHTGSKATMQCKYFLHGACNKGSGCQFSHDLATSKPNMVCRFYQAGSCAYGAKCRYDHVKAPARKPNPTPVAAPPGPTAVKESSVNVSRLHEWAAVPPPAVNESVTEQPAWQSAAPARSASEMLCPFAAANRCQRANCPYLHGLVCPSCGKQCLHPADKELQEKHLAECGASGWKQQKNTQLEQLSRGVECGICLEPVTGEHRPMACRRFGLLEGCAHAFCLDCIRNWRQGGSAQAEVVRSCPICREVSYFVVPSTHWLSDPEQKGALIDNYKQGMGKKDCKHFNFGDGSCPFGSSCFYSHRYRDGTEEEAPQLRQVAGDENTRIVEETTLWDFLEASNTSSSR